jgi:hypothetical protein
MYKASVLKLIKSKSKKIISLSMFCGLLYAEPYINVNAGVAPMYKLPSPATVFTVNSGYSFNQAFALEGGYSTMYSQQYSDAKVSVNIFDIAAKGTVPLSEMFQFYGRYGLGIGVNGTSGNGIANDTNYYGAFLLGAGGKLKLNDKFSVTLEDTGYIPLIIVTINGFTNAITAGLQYNF